MSTTTAPAAPKLHPSRAETLREIVRRGGEINVWKGQDGLNFGHLVELSDLGLLEHVDQCGPCHTVWTDPDAPQQECARPLTGQAGGAECYYRHRLTTAGYATAAAHPASEPHRRDYAAEDAAAAQTTTPGITLVCVIDNGRGDLTAHRPDCPDVDQARADGAPRHQAAAASLLHIAAKHAAATLAEAVDLADGWQVADCSTLPTDPPGWTEGDGTVVRVLNADTGCCEICHVPALLIELDRGPDPDRDPTLDLLYEDDTTYTRHVHADATPRHPSGDLRPYLPLAFPCKNCGGYDHTEHDTGYGTTTTCDTCGTPTYYDRGD